MKINIKDYYEYSSEGNDWTISFEKAIADIRKSKGGELVVSAGRYKTASITLCSDITLMLEEGAELYFVDDYDKYEIIEGSFEGVSCQMYKPFIYAKNETDICIEGTGTLNGNGSKWWKGIFDKSLEAMRPRLIYFEKCTDIMLKDINLINSPCWTVHPYWCDDVTVIRIKIKNPADSPNTDGINPDSCRNVTIKDCTIDVGDDCIAIKSGVEQNPILRACEDITISGCHMMHGHGGVVLGSESSGGIRNVLVKDCIFEDTDRGVRYKTRRRRGGHVSDIHFQNIRMDGVMCPFVFNMYYFCGKLGKEPWVSDPKPALVDEGTPSLNNILIENVHVENATSCAGIFAGLPEQKIKGIRFKDCYVSMKQGGKPQLAAMMSKLEPTSSAGFIFSNTEGVFFENTKTDNVIGKEFLVKDDSLIDIK